MLDSLTTGLLTGLSLIVAIGAQNAFVLRQGLRREHVGLVVAICMLSDVVLIAAGVAGIGSIVEHAPVALDVVRWLGVAFLTWYGVSALLRARRAESLRASNGTATGGRGAVAGKAIALTWLNPHVYLDTVLLLGSIANHQGGVGRWWFAVGACLASVLWFAGLGYGARAAGPLLANPRAWQVLDVLIGLTMLAIATSLALG
ncbi:LysE/ArgO family amino acid transporter [Nocardioides aquiterrae]|uniref:LysE/ArgO family amino acid transporter n=1 Tax=Nocardioides aquiterrae TaxID=203799 RepID=UPI0031DDAF77